MLVFLLDYTIYYLEDALFTHIIGVETHLFVQISFKDVIDVFEAFLAFLVAGMGIGPGAHRLFSHRAYKVKYGLKIFLIFCQQLSGLVRIFFK